MCRNREVVMVSTAKCKETCMIRKNMENRPGESGGVTSPSGGTGRVKFPGYNLSRRMAPLLLSACKFNTPFPNLQKNLSGGFFCIAIQIKRFKSQKSSKIKM